MKFVPLSLLLGSLLGLTVVACGGGEEGSTGADDGNGATGASGPGGSGAATGCTQPSCDAGSGGSGSSEGGGSGGVPEVSSGGSMASGGSPAVYDCERMVDTSTYAFDANIAPSQMPPGGLPVADTPLFVSLGFDDNPESSGMSWATNMLLAQGVRSSFFHTTDYAPAALGQWRVAADAGFEVGLHTQTHSTSYTTVQGTWSSEITSCFNVLTGAYGSGGLGIPKTEIFGFRAPFLEFNDGLLSELDAQGVWYDTSIQEGFDSTQDGTNLYFPYTLDNGSPGHTYNKSYGFTRSQFDLSPHPGLFELPVYALIVPPDSEADTYGFTPGLRGRISLADFVETGYKITGFDYNLWAQAGVNGAEFLAILKYSFDLRRAGNRAPFFFGAHTNDYSGDTEKQQALEQFITYVKTFPEVRVVNYKEVLDFMREPKALSCY